MLNIIDLTEFELEEILLIYIANNFKNYDAVHNGIGLEPYHFTAYPELASDLFEQCEKNQKDTEKTLEWFDDWHFDVLWRWQYVKPDDPHKEMRDLFKVTKRVLIEFSRRRYIIAKHVREDAKDKDVMRAEYELQKVEHNANTAVSICNKIIYGPYGENGPFAHEGEDERYVDTIQQSDTAE